MIRRIIHKQGLRQSWCIWCEGLSLKGPFSFRLGIVSYAMVIRPTVKKSSLRLVGSNSKFNPNKSNNMVQKENYQILLPKKNIIQLSPEGEVNSGGYIPRRETSRYIYPPLFADPVGDSCFGIHQIRWIKKCCFYFLF